MTPLRTLHHLLAGRLNAAATAPHPLDALRKVKAAATDLVALTGALIDELEELHARLESLERDRRR